MSVRAQNELWRAQNQRKTSPKELWASDLEALEVSGTPRGDQESLKEVCKSPEILIMSRQGAAGSPQRAPKELLESQNDVQISPGELHKGFEELRKRS